MPRRVTSVGLTWLALSISLAIGAEGERWTPHHVARLRSVTAAAVAPDGQRIAYLLSVPRRPPAEDDGPSWAELHVVDRDGNSQPYVTGEVNVGDPTWTADGKSIAFLAKRGKDEHRALYLIPATGGEARRVVSHGADINGFALAPDGRRVAFLATEPEPKDRAELKKKGFNQIVVEEELKPAKVWMARLDDAEAKPKALDLPGSASELRWSPKGDKLAVALAPTSSVDDSFMKRKIHVLDAEAGKVTAQVEHTAKLGKVAWSPDGQQLAFIAGADEHDPAAGRLMIASATGGAPRDLRPGFKGHFADLAWTDARTVLGLADVGVASRLDTVPADGSDVASKPLDGLVATALAASADGKTVAGIGQSPRHPGEVFLIEQDKAPRRLTDSNPWIKSLAFAPQEVVTYKARDGLEIEGVLIRPLDAPEGARVPLVLDVHGGPESHIRNGWLTVYAMPGQVLAAKGMAVFLPNYRGSTGRGVEFSELSQGDAAGKEFDDLVDAVDHFVKQGLADKDKVGVTGGSYGGFATAWCSTRYSDRFAAGVMFVGISDIISKTGTTDIPEEEFLVHARKRPWDDWLDLLKRSPIHHAKGAKTPLLILHGEDDPRVFPGQSLELYRFLKTAGAAPVRLVLYPGEGHGNQRAASRLDYNLRMVRWFEHYLKGPGGSPPPVEVDYKEPKAE